MTTPIERPKELSQSSIVRAVAAAAADRLAKRAVKHLQQIRTTLSGDDSELKSVWDEICTQAQGEESFFWEAYEEQMLATVTALIGDLPLHEREAIWFQSAEGVEWLFHKETCDDRFDPTCYPMCDDDVVKYVVNDHVLSAARRWSNPRIRACLDRHSRYD